MRQEYERRLNEEPKGHAAEASQLSTMIQKLKRSVARLIDAYEAGLLTKEEFELRLRNAKARLEKLEVDMQAVIDQAAAERELCLAIGQFEEFAQRVSDGLQEGDWTTRRAIIRALVNRIEIDPENVRVVCKVAPAPFASAPDSGGILRDCWGVISPLATGDGEGSRSPVGRIGQIILRVPGAAHITEGTARPQPG